MERKYDGNLPEFVLKLLRNPLDYEAQLLMDINLSMYSEFLLEMIPILKKFDPIQRLNTNFLDVHMVGDLHGDVESTSKIITWFMEKKISSLVFLGDYVDRGKNSLAVLIMLLGLQKSFPDKVLLLKGNHEDEKLNRRYGFMDQLKLVFAEHKDDAMEITDRIYNYLSVAAITPKNSFCVHGGIPFTKLSIEEMGSLKKPYSNLTSMKDQQLQDDLYTAFHQMQWNDPKEDQKELIEASSRGWGIFTFNKLATKNFLDKNGLKRVIRAHEASRGGYQNIFNGLILHIFSSEPYFGKINNAAMVHEREEGTRIVDLNLKEIDKIK